LAVLGALTPAAPARADQLDTTTYWLVATSPQPPDTTLPSDTYWAEVQAHQEYQQRQQ
jgi:hypothetical protein